MLLGLYEGFIKPLLSLDLRLYYGSIKARAPANLIKRLLQALNVRGALKKK
jgi:hypothetical protein